jgi:hypothetical protein
MLAGRPDVIVAAACRERYGLAAAHDVLTLPVSHV